MKNHPVKISEEEKVAWFRKQVEEKQRVDPLKSEEELVGFLRFCRYTFRNLYGRDVSGSFFRKLVSDMGVAREHSESVKKKRDFIFKLLDENQAFRENKIQTRKIVEAKFGERILALVFTEIWDEYHEDPARPKPEKNVDLFGQKPLFDE